MARFSNLLSYLIMDHVMTVLQPHPPLKDGWFGLVPVRSPLLRKSLLFSFPRVTKMFQFTPLASTAYGFS
jgi:hypothetical protein